MNIAVKIIVGATAILLFLVGVYGEAPFYGLILSLAAIGSLYGENPHSSCKDLSAHNNLWPESKNISPEDAQFLRTAQKNVAEVEKG